MDEQVRTELADLLSTGGRNLCTMPRMVGILLRQRCPDAEKTVAEVELALTSRCVRPMLESIDPVNEVELAERLVNETDMDPARALWVIATWVHALAGADVAQPLGRDWSAWNRLDVKSGVGGGSYRRVIGNLFVVSAAGAVGGAAMGLFLSLSGEAARLSSLEMLQDASPWLQVSALLMLGLLGGFAGAMLGWIAASGRGGAYEAGGGTSTWRLGLSAAGAFVGAASGVLAGLSVLGLIGVMLGPLAGAIVGVLTAEVLLRFWP
jgi:hypothetical protein